MEENEGTVSVKIRGRGVYRSYKYVFTHVSRNIQPDSLKHIILETNDQAEDCGPLDQMEDFDLVAMVASWKSAAIYAAFQEWVKSDQQWYVMDDKISAIMGDSTWAPSLLTLSEGSLL